MTKMTSITNREIQGGVHNGKFRIVAFRNYESSFGSHTQVIGAAANQQEADKSTVEIAKVMGYEIVPSRASVQ